MNSPASLPVAVVTGASAGLGLAIAKRLILAGYQVVGVGRNQDRLSVAKVSIGNSVGKDANNRFVAIASDVSNRVSCTELFARIQQEFGHVAVLVNCVGQSDRGTVQGLSRERLIELFDANLTTALFCSQAALPLLQQSRGVIVNIGSLASKVGARHLGGYPAAKHALAGLTQQMRLEWREFGVHVALVSPGPIRRDDAGQRYAERTTDPNLPAVAMQPGGGTTVRGLELDYVANQVLRAIQTRSPDVVLPKYTRLLIVLGHLFPRIGDWLLIRLTTRR